jgi:hypothetical protein
VPPILRSVLDNLKAPQIVRSLDNRMMLHPADDPRMTACLFREKGYILGRLLTKSGQMMISEDSFCSDRQWISALNWYFSAVDPYGIFETSAFVDNFPMLSYTPHLPIPMFAPHIRPPRLHAPIHVQAQT